MNENKKVIIELEKLTKPYFAEGQKEVDITAIWKYIESKTYNIINGEKDYLNPRFNIRTCDDEWYIEGDSESMGKFDEIEYPLKQINLYLEQELITLLELLHRL